MRPPPDALAFLADLNRLVHPPPWTRIKRAPRRLWWRLREWRWRRRGTFRPGESAVYWLAPDGSTLIFPTHDGHPKESFRVTGVHGDTIEIELEQP